MIATLAALTLISTAIGCYLLLGAAYRYWKKPIDFDQELTLKNVLREQRDKVVALLPGMFFIVVAGVIMLVIGEIA